MKGGHLIPAALGAAAAVGAAGTLAYAAFSAGSQLFGRTLIAPPVPPVGPAQIALTYDDGPNPAATPELLDVLAAADIRATFFLIGRFVRQQPELARRIAAAGHLIGNHTLTHPVLAWHPASRIRAELAGGNAAIEDTLGSAVSFFRPPHGARRPGVLRTADHLGLTTVQWNVITSDWKPAEPSILLARLELGLARNRRAGSASNILMHDGGHHGLGAPRLPTVEATRLLLQRYPTTSFVTVDLWKKTR